MSGCRSSDDPGSGGRGESAAETAGRVQGSGAGADRPGRLFVSGDTNTSEDRDPTGKSMEVPGSGSGGRAVQLIGTGRRGRGWQPGPGPRGRLDRIAAPDNRMVRPGACGARIGGPRVQSVASGSSLGPPDLGRNQARTALETGHSVELRAVCTGNHPRTERERRHRALKTRLLPSAHRIAKNAPAFFA